MVKKLPLTLLTQHPAGALENLKNASPFIAVFITFLTFSFDISLATRYTVQDRLALKKLFFKGTSGKSGHIQPFDGEERVKSSIYKKIKRKAMTELLV